MLLNKSILNQRKFSPVATLIAVFVNTVPVFLSFDFYTPLFFLLLAIINSIIVLRSSIKQVMIILLILISLPIGLFFLNIFFYTENTGRVVFSIFSLSVTTSSLTHAAIIFLRSLTLIYISVTYLVVTRPLELVSALMQQLHLSPKVGFSIYAAWNTIPFLKRDFDRIRKIQTIRRKGQKEKFSNTLQVITTLLIDSIRHAERLSISMTARGLEKTKQRTFLHESKWNITDTIYIMSYVVVTFLLLLFLIKMKLFNFGLG